MALTVVEVCQYRRHKYGNALAISPCSGFKVNAEILVFQALAIENKEM